MRPLLMGVGFLLLLIFLVWTVSKHAYPVQISKLHELDSRTTQNKSASRQGNGRVADRFTASPLNAQKILKYGLGEGEIGMIYEVGQTPVGPESFTVGKDGNILIADMVNHRILICSSNGTYLRNIDVPGITLNDVISDEQGRVYVYDQVRHALYQFDARGVQQSALNLEPSDTVTRGYFHVAGNVVYFADAAARDILIATLDNGILAPPDKSLERVTDGIHAESGRVYSVSVVRSQALQLQVWDLATQSVSQNLGISLPGILSARYVGEDQAQRFYVQIEKLIGSAVVLEVLTFSQTGEQLAATRLPENDYAIWTTKLVDVRTDGTIVQFLPEQNQAKLNMFSQ